MRFIAAITQHIPDKSFELVRYYRWYSNKMRGRHGLSRRTKKCRPEGDAVEVIDVSAHGAAPHPFQEVARVDQEGVGGRPAAVPEVLTGNAHRFAHRRGGCHRAHPAPSRALARGGCVHSGTDPPGETTLHPVARRPLPRLRHRTGHGVLRHLKRPAAPKCASRTPVQRPPALRLRV